MLIAHHVFVMIMLGTLAVVFNKLSMIQAIILFLSGVVIDVDHLFSYWYYQRDFTFSYKKIKAWCFRIGYKMQHFFMFHNVWFFLTIFLILRGTTYHKIVITGLLIHYILDIIYDAYWYFILKKNLRPYRRWIMPFNILKKFNLERYL